MSSRLNLKQIETKFRELDASEGRLNKFYDANKLYNISEGKHKSRTKRYQKSIGFYNVLKSQTCKGNEIASESSLAVLNKQEKLSSKYEYNIGENHLKKCLSMSNKLNYTGYRNNRKQRIENQVNMVTIRSVSHIESDIQIRTKELEKKIESKINRENENQVSSSGLFNRKKERKVIHGDTATLSKEKEIHPLNIADITTVNICSPKAVFTE